MNYYQDVFYKNRAKRSMDKYYNDIITKGNVKDSILDLGCGNGEFLDACANNRIVTTGVDICDRNIDHMFYKSDISTFNYGKYKSISCLGVLEHIENKWSVLKNIYNMSYKDTSIIILVPIVEFLAKRFGFKGTDQVKFREDQLPIHVWEDMFNSAGFKIISKWKDHQCMTWSWIMSRGWLFSPIKFLMAVFICILPLKYTYQVFFKLEKC